MPECSMMFSWHVSYEVIADKYVFGYDWTGLMNTIFIVSEDKIPIIKQNCTNQIIN